MKFTQAMQDAINLQINREMWSANLYLSMSLHFASEGLNGFSSWFRKQYAEEIEHAEDMMQYIIRRGGRVELKAVEAVPTTFASTLAIVEEAYKHVHAFASAKPKGVFFNRHFCLDICTFFTTIK